VHEYLKKAGRQQAGSRPWSKQLSSLAEQRKEIR
jgi:hypothetical protein